jgi:hypothetical protein
MYVEEKQWFATETASVGMVTVALETLTQV